MKREAVELLLKNGAHVNVQNNKNETMLHQAVNSYRNYFLILSKQLKHKYILNSHSLLLDIEHIVEILLDYGANVSLKDNFGKTPLYNAALNGKFDQKF